MVSDSQSRSTQPRCTDVPDRVITAAVQPTFWDSGSFHLKCHGRQLALNRCNLGGGSVWDRCRRPTMRKENQKQGIDKIKWPQELFSPVISWSSQRLWTPLCQGIDPRHFLRSCPLFSTERDDKSGPCQHQMDAKLRGSAGDLYYTLDDPVTNAKSRKIYLSSICFLNDILKPLFKQKQISQ